MDKKFDIADPQAGTINEDQWPKMLKLIGEKFAFVHNPNSFPNGNGEGMVKPELRIPKQGKRLNDWKAAWRKVKGRWKGGDNYQNLSKLANLSPETIADIVKAGDEGFLD